MPQLSAETFILWEPCTHSHAEVLPGYARYLLDLGFKVAVFATPQRFDEGLFSRFNDARITCYRLSQRQIRAGFRRHGLQQAAGIMITTARKISGRSDYQAEYQLFRNRTHKQRILLVEHDVKAAADTEALTPDIITLAPIDYHQVSTSVVNPHNFGNVAATEKTGAITTFITVGALRAKRRNVEALLNAVDELDRAGMNHFRIVVVGRGSLQGVPHRLRRYFNINGRIDFASLYNNLEQAHFFLPLLDSDNRAHDRYITTGTSGSFQLMRGFSKPGLLAKRFADHHGFNEQSAIVYPDNGALLKAMKSAIEMDAEAYCAMQLAMRRHAELVYQNSLSNLRNLIGVSARTI